LTLLRDEIGTYNEKIDSLQELRVFQNKMSLFPQKTIIEFKNQNKYNNPADEDFLDDSVFQGIETTLRKVEIRNFNISALTNNIFSKPSNLRILKLTGNDIISINSSAFTKLVLLQELNLSCNLISWLLPDTFHELASLEVLDLSRNKIDQLEKGLFKGLGSLKVMRLLRNLMSRNLIKTIPSMSRNLIKTIPSNAFAELDKLEE
jgi:Leucine-rich repeat (LRR) protein